MLGLMLRMLNILEYLSFKQHCVRDTTVFVLIYQVKKQNKT